MKYTLHIDVAAGVCATEGPCWLENRLDAGLVNFSGHVFNTDIQASGLFGPDSIVHYDTCLMNR